MEYKYQNSVLDHKIRFRFDGWLQTRRDNLECTHIAWIKNNRMMFDNGIYNSKTPIMVFLN